MLRRTLLPLALAAVTLGPATAQPPPAEYDVRLRFQIDAYRDQRLRPYFAMMKALEALGLQREPGPETEPEDPRLNRIVGTVPGANARRLLDVPAVQALV